jgi:hypothetical protein
MTTRQLSARAGGPRRATIHSASPCCCFPELLREGKRLTTTLFGYSASIFYQDNNWAISNAFLTCNMSTGQWVVTGNWPISIGTPSVNRQTGLALLQLGPVEGYRLYYHDANMAIQVLDYNPNTTEWYYGGTVSGDSQPTLNLAAEFHTEGGSASNITVLSVKDASNLEESRFNKDDSYHICM